MPIDSRPELPPRSGRPSGKNALHAGPISWLCASKSEYEATGRVNEEIPSELQRVTGRAVQLFSSECRAQVVPHGARREPGPCKRRSLQSVASVNLMLFVGENWPAKLGLVRVLQDAFQGFERNQQDIEVERSQLLSAAPQL